MCYMLYLGADASLPLIPTPDWKKFDFNTDDWLRTAPRLVVYSLEDTNRKVLEKFSEQTVVNAGSYEGCGCGFNFCVGREPFEEDQAAIQVSQESRQALANYIAINGVTSLYGCWNGDEELPIESEKAIEFSLLTDRDFEFPERVRIRIVASSQSSEAD